jgi:dCMP deaminase
MYKETEHMSNPQRPHWDEIFMNLAKEMARRSTCNRLHVDAVLVKGKHPVMTGYNGSLPGHEQGVGCLMYEGSCKRTIHAERNVLDNCARLGIATEGATLYVTHYPCPDCTKSIANAGIKEVIYGEFYPHKYPNQFHRDLILREYK